jgi:4-oxalocrotonate tautomerase
MPLARIDLPESVEPSRRSLIGDIVYQTLVDVLNAPTGDKFQIITAHDSESLRIDPSYLGIHRSAAAFTIDITLNATLVDRLNTQADVRPEDVLIVLTEVAKENWSFGNGEAPYA